LHVGQANLHNHDGKTDLAVEIIQVQSRTEKRIHLRFCALQTGQRMHKAPVETTLNREFLTGGKKIEEEVQSAYGHVKNF
jgi:hypothetical protein